MIPSSSDSDNSSSPRSWTLRALEQTLDAARLPTGAAPLLELGLVAYGTLRFIAAQPQAQIEPTIAYVRKILENVARRVVEGAL